MARWQREVIAAVRQPGGPVVVPTRTPGVRGQLHRWRDLRQHLWWLPLLLAACAGIVIIVLEGDVENLPPTLIALLVLGGALALIVRWLQGRVDAEWIRAHQLNRFAQDNGLTALMAVPRTEQSMTAPGVTPPGLLRRDVVAWDQNGFAIETGTQRSGHEGERARRYISVRLGAATPFDPRALAHHLGMADARWEVEEREGLLMVSTPGDDSLHEPTWRRTFALVDALVGPALRKDPLHPH